jgi:hypothetical protein
LEAGVAEKDITIRADIKHLGLPQCTKIKNVRHLTSTKQDTTKTVLRTGDVLITYPMHASPIYAASVRSSMREVAQPCQHQGTHSLTHVAIELLTAMIQALTSTSDVTA